MASLGDRSTGTAGNGQAADFIRTALERLSGERGVPAVRRSGHPSGRQRAQRPGPGRESPASPLRRQRRHPPGRAPAGLTGPLVYVGSGELGRLNGKRIEGAVLLMELDSGAGWLRAADFGANALIYVDRGESPRFLFEDKFELSPSGFPRFWASAEELARVFGDFASTPAGLVAEAASLRSEAAWQNVISENIYCLIPGSSAERRKEVLLVEAFYDSTARVAGIPPAPTRPSGRRRCSSWHAVFKENPPERTVLLAATSGHAQSLAGLRELVWAFPRAPRTCATRATSCGAW